MALRDVGGHDVTMRACKTPTNVTQYHVTNHRVTLHLSLSVLNGNERPRFRAGVDGGGADDLVVNALLDDMRGPAAGARDDKQRGEHRGRHSHAMIGPREIPSKVANIFFSRIMTCSMRSAISNISISPASCDRRRATSLMTAFLGSAMV